MVYSIRDGVKNAIDMFTNKPFPGGKFTEAQKTAMTMGADLSNFMDKVKTDEYLYPVDGLSASVPTRVFPSPLQF